MAQIQIRINGSALMFREAAMLRRKSVALWQEPNQTVQPWRRSKASLTVLARSTPCRRFASSTFPRPSPPPRGPSPRPRGLHLLPLFQPQRLPALPRRSRRRRPPPCRSFAPSPIPRRRPPPPERGLFLLFLLRLPQRRRPRPSPRRSESPRPAPPARASPARPPAPLPPARPRLSRPPARARPHPRPLPASARLSRPPARSRRLARGASRPPAPALIPPAPGAGPSVADMRRASSAARHAGGATAQPLGRVWGGRINATQHDGLAVHAAGFVEWRGRIHSRRAADADAQHAPVAGQRRPPPCPITLSTPPPSPASPLPRAEPPHCTAPWALPLAHREGVA
jgi:hypothetical protein